MDESQVRLLARDRVMLGVSAGCVQALAMLKKSCSTGGCGGTCIDVLGALVEAVSVICSSTCDEVCSISGFVVSLEEELTGITSG